MPDLDLLATQTRLVVRKSPKFSPGDLMLTNLEKERAGADQLVAVYRARWAIEIQFRAWKQSLNLTKALNRKSNEHHM